MKALSFTIFLILFISSCNKKIANYALKDHQSVDGIKIGMPIKDALRILDKKFVVKKKKVRNFDDEPESTEYLVSTQKKVQLFSFNGGHEQKNSSNIFRIVIKNPAYTTPEGINVGMTVKDLKTKTNLKSADFNFEDGLFLLSSTFDGGFWINIDDKKEYKFTYNNPSIKDIPNELTIKGIVIF